MPDLGRLVHSADFKRVLATVPRLRSAHFAAHHVAARPAVSAYRSAAGRSGELSTGEAQESARSVDKSSVEGLWLGVVLPKRLARRAVTRQLIKRQMREAVRRRAPSMPAGLWVLRLRAGFDLRQFPSAASRALRETVRAELDAMLAAATR